MSALAKALLAELAGDHEALAELARLLGPLLPAPAPAAPATGEWLDVSEAAAYLRASRQRIYDLVSAERLRCAKDGSRSLFRREWLDAYIEAA